MKKDLEYKSEESRQREQAHWFGREGGNKRHPLSQASEMREFYRWAVCATEEEIKEFIKNKDNSLAKRKYLQALAHCERVQDFHDITNQISGMPKQEVALIEAPEIRIDLTRDEDEDELPPDEREEQTSSEDGKCAAHGD